MRIVYNKSRLHVILLFFILAFSVLASRLTYIQFIKYSLFKEKAANQYSFLLTLEPQRGNIYDRNMRALACNLKADSLYATPPHVTEKEAAASSLSKALNVDEKKILERLCKKKAFIWVKRKLSPEEVKKVEALNIGGLDYAEERKRFYPNGSLASHILGFVDIDNKGLEGIELLYDDYLKGEVGWKAVKRDAKGRELASETTISLPPSNGYSVVLTLDEIIQHITEKALDGAYSKNKAKGATAIVMDPNNGHILALANRPTFDPNRVGDSEIECRRNRAVADCFEPGSAFKIVTASAALNEDKVVFEDIFFCENGSWNIRGHLLHDHKPHGKLTFKEVIEKSSNIGTAKVAIKIGENNLYKYIKLFGFGYPTRVDLPGEVSGLLKPPSKWSKFTISSIPMGQEIGVTAIQMACAISAIANGGMYYHPMMVREIRDEKDQSIKKFEPKSVRRVISQETAAGMKEILKGVVENGTGKKAQIKDYSSAGKTGTAQKVEPPGIYSHSKFIATFIGFAPAEDPKIVICVFVDEPTPVYYGGTVSAPVFKQIADETLKYLELEKDGIVTVKK